MAKYVLSEIEKRNFGVDEYRGRIRQLAAEGHSVDETIQIVDEEGNLFDTVSGDIEGPPETPRDGVAAVVESFSEEEILQMARLETVLKPEVEKRLLNQARDEIRAELRDKTDALLKARAELQTARQNNEATVSTLIKSHQKTLSELSKLQAAHSKLKGKQPNPDTENPSSAGASSALPPGAPGAK